MLVVLSLFEVHHPLDGDQLLRRPDRQFRHRLHSCCRSSPTCERHWSSPAVLSIPVLVLAWRLDPFRARRWVSLAGALTCAAAVTVLSLAYTRGALGAVSGRQSHLDLRALGRHDRLRTRHQRLDRLRYHDADRLRTAASEPCHLTEKPPNIIMVLDEASFDITAAPGVKVPPHYRRSLPVVRRQDPLARGRGLGRPDLVHRIQRADRPFGAVLRPARATTSRGSPPAGSSAACRRRCGAAATRPYQLYPAYGAFLSARKFQDHHRGRRFRQFQGHEGRRPRARSLLFRSGAEDDRERAAATSRCSSSSTRCSTTSRGGTSPRPELTPDWHALGNDPEVDEYLRRQSLSAQRLRATSSSARQDFPDEPFLLLRFGDHQPRHGEDHRSRPRPKTMMTQSIDGATTRATSRPTTPSTPINFQPKICRPRSSAGGALSPAGGAGGGGPAARSLVRRAEEDPATLPRAVFRLRRRRRGAAIQPPADRRRVDQGNGVPLVCARRAGQTREGEA